MRFQGKRVLVTGAASGIGRATAVRMANEGAIVTIGDFNRDGLAQTAELIGSTPRQVHFDAADTQSCKALVAAATMDGGLDILCNIAGVLDWGPTLEFDEARFERVLRINLFSVYTLCRAALPYLIVSKGNIVNMSSTAGLAGIAYTVAYSASKHGVNAITKSLAIEFGSKEVRVNAVCPTQVNTAMGNSAPPPGDVDWALVMRNVPKLASGGCEPEDIADAIAWLASNEARKVSGITLPVDCAQTAG